MKRLIVAVLIALTALAWWRRRVPEYESYADYLEDEEGMFV